MCVIVLWHHRCLHSGLWAQQLNCISFLGKWSWPAAHKQTKYPLYHESPEHKHQQTVPLLPTSSNKTGLSFISSFSSAIFVTFVRLFTVLYIPAWSYCKCPWWITIRTSGRLRLHEKMQRKAHNDWSNSSFSCVNLFCFGVFWRILKTWKASGVTDRAGNFEIVKKRLSVDSYVPATSRWYGDAAVSSFGSQEKKIKSFWMWTFLRPDG